MKLLLVAGTFPERSETFIYRKAVGLAARGHDVTIASRAAGDWSAYPAPLPPTLRVEVWPPDMRLHAPGRVAAAALGSTRALARAPAGVRALVSAVRAHPLTRDNVSVQVLRHLPLVGRRFDVVHFEFLGLAGMYPLARAVTSSPVVVSCRGTETHTLSRKTGYVRDALVATYRDADAVHCVSQHLADAIRAVGGPHPNLWVNRPALDLDELPVRSSSGGPLRLVSVGRLVWQKGYDHLLLAYVRMRERGVAFHAQIVGDGELRSSLAFAIADLGLGDHVELVGAVSSEEALRRIAAADVFVLSSHTEGISNAAIEAMAIGLPIVTTAAGGMPEVVEDGVEGFVVAVRDADAIADRLARFATDRTLVERMGAAARARAHRDHEIGGQLARFEACYEALARRGSAASSR